MEVRERCGTVVSFHIQNQRQSRIGDECAEAAGFNGTRLSHS